MEKVCTKNHVLQDIVKLAQELKTKTVGYLEGLTEEYKLGEEDKEEEKKQQKISFKQKAREAIFRIDAPSRDRETPIWSAYSVRDVQPRMPLYMANLGGICDQEMIRNFTKVRLGHIWDGVRIDNVGKSGQLY